MQDFEILTAKLIYSLLYWNPTTLKIHCKQIPGNLRSSVSCILLFVVK